MVTRFDKHDEEFVEKFGGCWCGKSGEEAVNSIPKDMGGGGNAVIVFKMSIDDYG